MIVSVNQPYFAPFPGFFRKAALSDVLVLLDNVQFPRGTTWMTRNRFKNDQGTLWLTVPVLKKGLGLQRIDRVKIFHDGRWNRKHLAGLKSAYAKAPYLKQHLDFFNEVFSSRYEKIIDLNRDIIHYLLSRLEIDAKVVLQSELGIKSQGDRLLVDICRAMGASRLLVQNAAKKHLNPVFLRELGIQLSFLKSGSLVYPQLWGPLIPNLSAFDLILNCGPKAREIMMIRSGDR